MVDLLAIFRAGFVRRWHTNPDLAHTVDRIDGHGARVARIIIALHPGPDVALLKAALIHDDGESAVGDVKAPTKDKFRVIADALDELEYIASAELWGHWQEDLSPNDAAWLKFADRLDAYMWAAHHAPHVLDGDGWPEAREWLCEQAVALDCVTVGFRKAIDMGRARLRQAEADL